MKVEDVEKILFDNIDKKGLEKFYNYLALMLIEEPPLTTED
jgi:hypothetical protein